MPSSKLTPPLKWPGGKRRLVPVLEPLWQHHEQRRLVEPFCGGLAVSLGLEPRRALINDINVHTINFFRCLQKGMRTTLPMSNNRELFYRYRERFNNLIAERSPEGEDAAALFYYLNRTGFNGLCRFNKQGRFNVPFGRYETINYRSDFHAYVSVLRHWEFTLGDFADVPTADEDFIYADPPYDVDFTQYSHGGFDWPEQERLAQWLHQHKGPVVVSNQATKRIIELYRQHDFTLRFLPAPRSISRDGNRVPAIEVLALHNLPSSKLSGTFASAEGARRAISRRRSRRLERQLPQRRT